MPEYGGGGIIRTGLHKPLEDAADALLHESLKSVTRNSDKSDILTPWKEQDRRKREVYVSEGTPDPALRRGIFTRGYNPAHPHLNSVQGQIPSKKGSQSNPWDSE